MPRVTGAPYSARETNASIQAGTAGATETSSGQYDLVWRDSAGRTRRESHAEEGKRAPCRSFLAQVQDPVAGYAYLVDPVNKVVHRAPLVAGERPDPNERDAEQSLGTKTISGVTVVGFKTTRTAPPSPRRPNDPPRTFTVESWRSPELQVLIYSKTTDQDGSGSIFALQDLSKAEPDPALLRPPAGYQIVDEKEGFIVRTGDGGPAAGASAGAGRRSSTPWPAASLPIVAHAANPSTSPVPLRAFDRFLPLENGGDHSAAISLGDVNGDGNLDIVLSTGRHWESPIRLFFGDGKGGFKSMGDIGSRGYASYGVPLADLNGDGILDLAVAHRLRRREACFLRRWQRPLQAGWLVWRLANAGPQHRGG